MAELCWYVTKAGVDARSMFGMHGIQLNGKKLSSYKLQVWLTFKRATHRYVAGLQAPGFLKLLWFMRWFVCVCRSVSVFTPEGINNQWHDMVWYRRWCDWLNKFTAFSYSQLTLAINKWMGVAILTQHIVNAYQRTLRWCSTSYRKTTRKIECFRYKGEWANA